MNLEKFVWTGVAAGVALCIGTAPIAAKPGAMKPSGPKSTVQATVKVKPTSAKPTGPRTMKTTGGQKTTVSGAKAKTTGAVMKSAKTTTSTATAAKGNSKAARTTTTTNSTTTTTTTTTTTNTSGGTTTPMPLNKAQQQLTKNTNLQSKLQTRLGTQLPAGTTVVEAASGFKNLGQFVAAVNVSNNLGIPFADLKAKMTGLTVDGQPLPQTGTPPATTYSLGQSIQQLKGLDATTATTTANTATTQASAEINSTTTTSTTSTTKAKPGRKNPRP